MAKKNKWDEYLQFDDWKQDDGFTDEKETEEVIESTSPREVQGIGIQKDVEEFDLFGMISGLNAQNEEYISSFKEDEEQSIREQRELERQAEEEEKAAKAKAIYESEQAEKEARLFAEQEAEAKRIAEELEKKQNSFLNKAGKAISGKTIFGKDKKHPPKKESNNDIDSEAVTNTHVLLNIEEDSASKKEASKNTVEQSLEIKNDELSSSVASSVSSDIEIGKGKVDEARSHEKNKKINKEVDSKQNKKQMADISSTESSKSKKEEDTVNETSNMDKKTPYTEDALEVEEEANKESTTSKKSGKAGNLLGFLKKKDKGEEPDLHVNKKKDQKTKEPDWKYVATHDDMTGLWNRTAYETAKSEKRNYPFGVVYIDVNNLKYANDLIGHEAGDALLKGVAAQIEETFPEQGYRIGGDEFVVIVEDISYKKANDILSKKRNDFHKSLEKMTKNSNIEGLIYAASFGFAFTDGSKGYEEVSKDAEKAMYREKETYKKAHPQYDMRGPEAAKALEKKKKAAAASKTNVENYDEQLTKEQRALKKTIKENHVKVSTKSTQDIIREIQSRASDVIAILIASPTFDQLFIIQTAATFIEITMESDYLIDYSYLYIIYSDCPVYKGSDEYLEEVTTLFNAIGRGFKTGKIKNEKDLLNVQGINIFKNIYVDM